MDVKQLSKKLTGIMGKYRYAVLILAIGLILITLPGKSTKKTENNPSDSQVKSSQTIQAEALADILQSISGAGKVEVLLSMASGEKTIYQTNHDTSISGANNETKIETVVITDGQRSETGLVSQVNPPTYLGAIVVCQGADSPTVRLAITQAVAKITGLGTDAICVLKMK